MTLRTYVISRILLTIPMILILLTTVFIVMRVLPGDPVQMHFEKMATPETVNNMRIMLGLNKPIWAQYIDYIVGLFRGDLGKSMQDFHLLDSRFSQRFPQP